MNSMERMRAMVEGKPVDRVGVASWYHMPLLDGVSKDFAKGIINSCREMHWDICKLQYHGWYMNEAMGNKISRSTRADTMMGPLHSMAVYHPSDYRNLKMPSLTSGPLALELETTKIVVNELGGKLPILGTIFSPMNVAKGIYGGENQYILRAIENNPQDVHKGLEIITEATIKFIDELLKAGCDGMFLAEAWASLDDMDKKTHDEFVKKYDLQILNHIKDKTWFNMLHVHGWRNLRFQEYEDANYPVQSYSWEDVLGDETVGTSLKKARTITDKILIGGIEHWHDYSSDTNDREAVKAVLKKRLTDALAQLGPDDKKFVFAPGCSVKMHVPEYRMWLMHEVIEEVTGIA